MNSGSLLSELTAILHNSDEVILLKSISGTDDAEQLVGLINNFCIEHFSSPVSACYFARLSIGASLGLRLENGKDIFLKINKLRSDPSANGGHSIDELTAKSRAQEALYTTGFPCPAIVLHPISYHGALYTVQEYVDVGAQTDAHIPSIRRASAQGFAELTKRVNARISAHGFTEIDIYRIDDLFPAPRNPNSNFAKNAEKAGWIDEIALKSKQTILSSSKNVVLGHCDWSMKNMRFSDDRLAMVYDWDSIILQDEFHLLGNAASKYNETWDIPVRITPTQEEAYDFVVEYERMRGIRFTREEWIKISACVTYIFCHSARWQIAYEVAYEGSYIEALNNMRGGNYLQV